MAIKNWKLEQPGLWRKKLIGSGYFEKIPKEITLTHNPKLKKYNVSIWNNLDSLEVEKVFKTKSQALKFAKCYMKTENTKKCRTKK